MHERVNTMMQTEMAQVGMYVFKFKDAEKKSTGCLLTIYQKIPANEYMVKVNNKSTRKMCEITTSLTSFWCLYC